MGNNPVPGIVPATPEHIEAVGAALRTEHLREIRALMPLAGPEALRRSARAAAVCYTAAPAGEPLCVFGVSAPAPLTGAGLGWLLGTRAMDRHGIWLADVSRRLLPLLHRESGAWRIHNWVPVGYRRALRWLEWLGFAVEDAGGLGGGVPHVHVWHDDERGSA